MRSPLPSARASCADREAPGAGARVPARLTPGPRPRPSSSDVRSRGANPPCPPPPPLPQFVSTPRARSRPPSPRCPPHRLLRSPAWTAPLDPGLRRPDLVAVLGVLAAWALGHGKESTDDAQVEGRVVSVSPRVGGQVEKVLIIDNQSVKQGDLLVQLDTRDLDAKLASARADLESAKAGLASAQVNLKLTGANSEASLRQARGGLTQASSGVVATRSALAQARAEVEAAEAADRLAQARLDTGAARTSRRRRPSRGRTSTPGARARSRRTRSSSRPGPGSRAPRPTSPPSGGGVTTAQGRLAAAETAPDQVKAPRSPSRPHRRGRTRPRPRTTSPRSTGATPRSAPRLTAWSAAAPSSRDSWWGRTGR